MPKSKSDNTPAQGSQTGSQKPNSPAPSRDAKKNRENSKLQEQNREKMGVRGDHKTKDMERRHRGTFP